jgi:hypothetical protein
VFGTYALNETTTSAMQYVPFTADEAATSTYMQAAWVAFAKDPATGLKNLDCWPTWTAGNGTNGLVELGVDSKLGAVFVPSDSYDGACRGLGYNVGP